MESAVQVILAAVAEGRKVVEADVGWDTWFSALGATSQHRLAAEPPRGGEVTAALAAEAPGSSIAGK